jgi:small subunit ribosomal protein S1
MMDDRELDESAEESFADLLEQSLGKSVPLVPGQKVKAKILKITSDWIFLDIGQKGEGVLDKKELFDPEGNLPVTEGETLEAYFVSSRGGEKRFTTRLGGAGTGAAQLEEAYRSGIPVEGTVVKEIKGGYEVKVAGAARAFCPYSQMGLRRAESPEEYLGRTFSFRITKFAEEGRNIVVSHRALLEEERRKKREELRERLHEGMTVRGEVTSLQNFGAFVDIGGIEGLIPISEVGWGKIDDIRDALSPGQEVEVVAKSLDWENNRFSFSLRETLADPWLQVPGRYPEGSVQTGKVVRLATFGAFVELEPGIDGLVHISKLGAGKRINHPREVVSEGQSLEVRVESVDREARRLSLVPAEAAKAQDQERRAMDEFRRKAAEEPKGMGTLGDLLQAKKSKKDRKK